MLYLGALSASDESLANILDLKHRRSLDVVPILLGKRISAEEEDKKRVTEKKKQENDESQEVKVMATNAFFLPPFFPFDILLFFPTAITSLLPLTESNRFSEYKHRKTMYIYHLFFFGAPDIYHFKTGI